MTEVKTRPSLIKVWLQINKCLQRYFTKDSGLYLYFRIRHSLTHLRPVILSADWSISRLQSWTCSSLPTVAEFVKLTQSIVIEIQRQSADLYKVQLCNRPFFCSVHSALRGKGIRVSPAWLYLTKYLWCLAMRCSFSIFARSAARGKLTRVCTQTS